VLAWAARGRRGGRGPRGAAGVVAGGARRAPPAGARVLAHPA
jgi:hypothetical protein